MTAVLRPFFVSTPMLSKQIKPILYNTKYIRGICKPRFISLMHGLIPVLQTLITQIDHLTSFPHHGHNTRTHYSFSRIIFPNPFALHFRRLRLRWLLRIKIRAKLPVRVQPQLPAHLTRQLSHLFGLQQVHHHRV